MNALRVLIASGFGALIGSLTALELLPYLGIAAGLWPLCALLGGGIGYLSYEPARVWQGVVQVSRRTLTLPSLGSRRDISWFLTGLLLVALHWCAAFIFMAFTIEGFAAAASQIQTPNWELGFIFLVTYPLMMCGVPLMMGVDFKRPDIKAASLRWYPASKTYWLYTLVFGTIYFIRDVTYGLASFLKAVIVFIHSDARTTCFTGGLFGTAVGVFAGSWLMGALAGAAIGLVSYELIGKRLLKTTSI